MNASVSSRSTAQAGRLQAGQALDHLPLSEAIAAALSVADCDQLRPMIERRKVAAVAAADAHGEPDPLLEDDQLAVFTGEASRLTREVARCNAALERIAARRAELVVAEAQAAARQVIKAAEADCGEAERLTGLYTEIALRLGDVLDQLDQRQRRILAARAQAAQAGIADEGAHLKTPAERRFRPVEFVMVEVVEERARGPIVTDAQGRPLNGRGGIDHSTAPAPVVSRRMVERMVRAAAYAPDLARVAVFLPSPDPDAPPLVARKGGR